MQQVSLDLVDKVDGLLVVEEEEYFPIAHGQLVVHIMDLPESQEDHTLVVVKVVEIIINLRSVMAPQELVVVVVEPVEIQVDPVALGVEQVVPVLL